LSPRIFRQYIGGDRKIEVSADRINLEFVLGNKVMVGTVNAGREHFEAASGIWRKRKRSFPAGWARC
jgi:glucose 1-dehydrogenase